MLCLAARGFKQLRVVAALVTKIISSMMLHDPGRKARTFLPMHDEFLRHLALLSDKLILLPAQV